MARIQATEEGGAAAAASAAGSSASTASKTDQAGSSPHGHVLLQHPAACFPKLPYNARHMHQGRVQLQSWASTDVPGAFVYLDWMQAEQSTHTNMVSVQWVCPLWHIFHFAVGHDALGQEDRVPTGHLLVPHDLLAVLGALLLGTGLATAAASCC